MRIKEILAENIIPLIMSIFALGGVSTMISLHGIDLAELQEKVQEMEQNKASKADLQILDDRVRRKLNGELKKSDHLMEQREMMGKLKKLGYKADFKKQRKC